MTLKLCYVEHNEAYFTSLPLTGCERQLGDDWDDAPFEHNAEPPYKPRRSRGDTYELCKVMFSDVSCERADEGYGNSPYSVDFLNLGGVPWLRLNPWTKNVTEIYAGCSVEEFAHAIDAAGGVVWFPIGLDKPLNLEHK